jgi:hypothetical protein
LWTEQGYLETTPGASIDYEFIAERLKDVFEGDEDRFRSMELSSPAAVASESKAFRNNSSSGRSSSLGGLQVDESGAARPREPGLGAEASAWQSSGSHYVHGQRDRRAGRRRKPQAVKEAVVGED